MTDKENREARVQHVMELLDRAIHTGTLVAINVKDKATGKPVDVLAEQWVDKQGNMALRPIARLFMDKDPNAELILPEALLTTFGRTPQEALQNALGTPA